MIVSSAKHLFFLILFHKSTILNISTWFFSMINILTIILTKEFIGGIYRVFH